MRRPLLVTAAALGAVLACSSRFGFDDGNDVFEPSPEGGVQPPPPPPCGVHCSRDLKQVLDGCEGAETVLATCNADEGCGNGKCVDACTAATLNKGSIGCDFWTVIPADAVHARGICFTAMVANTWDRAVSITAEYDNRVLDISKSTYLVERKEDRPSYTLLEGALPPGQVAIVFLSHDDQLQSAEFHRCPEEVTPALLTDPMRPGTARTKAFRLRSDAPVSAYSMAPYGGAASYRPTATLLLPVSSWATNYVAASPLPFGEFEWERVNGAPIVQTVAREDDTEVSLRPTVDVLGTWDVEGAKAGVTQTWTLGKGEVLQLVQRPSLAGSPIEANKPIGVFGGSECSSLPALKAACDLLQQQIPAVSQWGIEYAVVPFAPRVSSFGANAREMVPYSIVAAVDGTELAYEPSRPRGAPERLDANQSAGFITDEIFVVRSQDSKHPFHVNVYMTGGQYGGGLPGTVTSGDPDYVNVPAGGQYLDRYVFFTDLTYPDTTLTVVRKKTTSGFMPVELECGGEITGFQPLGTEYEYAWVKLTEAFIPQLGSGACGYGRQEARSKGPFAITVWGIGPWASYGYVGGTGLRPINDAVPPALK